MEGLNAVKTYMYTHTLLLRAITLFVCPYYFLCPATKGGQSGVPRIRMLSNNHAKPFDQRLLWSSGDIVQQYEQHGGHLTDPWQVGKDPLEGNSYKNGIRHIAFTEKFRDFRLIFSKLVNGDSSMFTHGLKFYLDITRRH